MGYPKVVPSTGYKFAKWDKGDDTPIDQADITVTAKATGLGNVIPAEKEDGTPNEKPEGYKAVSYTHLDVYKRQNRGWPW